MNKLFSILMLQLLFVSCGVAQEKSETKKETTSTEDKVVKTEEEWKSILSPQEYQVLRQQGTERAFTGDLLENKDEGTYICAACDFPLFESDTKFKSGTGWPSFFDYVEGNVGEHVDNTYGMRRVEVVCNRCDSHLGHVFDDGPDPTGLRYCINSVSLNFITKK